MHQLTQPNAPSSIDHSPSAHASTLLTEQQPCVNPAKLSRRGGDSDAVGDYATKAITKAFRKMVKYEREVLDDTDIEALHQMRIGLRRLRTTILTFEHLLDFPEAVQDVTIKPLVKRLGRVRDLDVLLLALSDHYLPHVPKKERKVLKNIRSVLQKKRDRQFKQMKQFLLSES